MDNCTGCKLLNCSRCSFNDSRSDVIDLVISSYQRRYQENLDYLAEKKRIDQEWIRKTEAERRRWNDMAYGSRVFAL